MKPGDVLFHKEHNTCVLVEDALRYHLTYFGGQKSYASIDEVEADGWRVVKSTLAKTRDFDVHQSENRKRMLQKLPVGSSVCLLLLTDPETNRFRLDRESVWMKIVKNLGDGRYIVKGGEGFGTIACRDIRLGTELEITVDNIFNYM